MLALLGFGTIGLFTLLVMTNRLSAVAALIQLVINGGTEVDVLTGGDGNDRIAGQQ